MIMIAATGSEFVGGFFMLIIGLLGLVLAMT